MNEIVEYHNDFNRLSLGKFNELEQNLLMAVLVNCRNQGDTIIKMDYNDVLQYVNKRKNITKRELLELVVNLSTNFFKLDFKVIKKQGNLKCQAYYNLFSMFEIHIREEENLLEQEIEQEFSHLILKVNSDFAYLINELTSDFTQFELNEFLYLRGKYPKILYRLLKQFRTKGYFIATWDNFKEQMGIPPSFSNEKIETLVLKPCVKKLSENIKTYLFDARIPFENLEYKLKKESSRRGKPKVTHIEFTFKPQKASCLDERQDYINAQNAKKPIVEPQEPHYITELKELCEKKIELKTKNGDIIKLLDILCDGEGNYFLLRQKNNNSAEQAPLDYDTGQKIIKAAENARKN